MTNAEMLARVRSMLDEATAELYIDATELYPALSLAQIELSKTIADNWHERQGTNFVPVNIPLAIQDLIETEKNVITTSAVSTAISADPLQIISCQWQSDGAIVDGSPYCIEIAQGVSGRKILINSLLSDGLFFFFADQLLTVHPVSTNGSAEAEITFFDTPVDITSGVQPETNAVAHDAIVERACWILLKDRETEQANTHLQMYGALLQGLIK